MELALYYTANTCALAPCVTLTEAGADFRGPAAQFPQAAEFYARLPEDQPELLLRPNPKIEMSRFKTRP